MTMSRRRSTYKSVDDLRSVDFSRKIGWEAAKEERARLDRSRQTDAAKYDAMVDMGGVPCPGKYLGTRIKDGWHFMEVRLRGSFQSRTYVMPRQVTWKGDAPELKMGNKASDFLTA